MREITRGGMRRRVTGVLAVVALAASACDVADDGGVLGPITDDLVPRDVTAESRWIVDHWNGLQPVGGPAVEVSWALPAGWDGEPFRVYAKQASRNSYTLVATVTSCAAGICRYTDVNVAPGQSYDYFVATELHNGAEEPSTRTEVRVPSTAAPAAPAAPRAVALDNGVFLQWQSTGAEFYRVFLERVGSDSVFYEIGQTDGTGYLDQRAENGVTYVYRIAAVDDSARVSARSGAATATPRPDYHAELVYLSTDSLAAAGFRFLPSAADNPVRAANAPDAHWRLDLRDGSPVIRPVGGASVAPGVFTTALTCGPGSDADCESVDQAPAASAFTTGEVLAEAGNTYVFRVAGADGRTHYAKLRVQGITRDARGRTVMIFDWAYQLRPELPSLNRG